MFYSRTAPVLPSDLVEELHRIYAIARPSDQAARFEKLMQHIEKVGADVTNQKGSVLQSWVMLLPLREQGCLMTAVRGCDLTPKRPLDSLERRIVSAIRAGFMVAADPRETDSEPGSFMSLKIPDAKTEKLSTLGHYPLHWVAHVMHACEVLGYRHPDPHVSAPFRDLYTEFCHMLHVPMETFETYSKRMTEDRIAAGNVVS